MNTLLTTAAALFTVLPAFSQLIIQNQVLATSGESFTGSIVVDYTFGETFTSTFPFGSSFVITQGFQQPVRRKIGLLGSFVSIDELEIFGVEVYPNPFRGEITVEVPENSRLEITIYDNAGRLVYSSQLAEMVTTIGLSELSVGNYQLITTDNQNQIGRMPIIKMH